jgi:hypothetical protein
MKKSFTILLSLVILIFTVSGMIPSTVISHTDTSLTKGDFYVSPKGNDQNPGTKIKPFKTIVKAQEAVRKKIAAGLTDNIVVIIHGGTYEQVTNLTFDSEDSGTQKYSITYAAAPGEKVVISGGRKITGWKKGQGQIWTTELTDVRDNKWYFRQLFVNGKRAIRARVPNIDDKSPWWHIKTSTAKPGAPDQNITPIIISVDHPIKAWNNITDVEFIYLNNNDGSRKRVGSVNETDQLCTLSAPHNWTPKGLPGYYQIGYPLADIFGVGACYFENALEMLDQPGEWYLDRQTGILSYWPRADEELNNVEVVAPVVQKTLLSVTGTIIKPVINLNFKGIYIEHVDWPLPPYGFAAMFGCLQLTSDGGKPPIKFLWIESAVSYKYARYCNFTDGGIAHVGGIGMSLLNGCSRNGIEGNQIYDLGGGGITAGALLNRDTWQWADPVAEDDHQGYRITNNYIHNCGLDYFGSVGITISGTQEALVAHNLIHDISYAGIVITGNEAPQHIARNNTIEYNHIYHVQTVAVDGGGIYCTFPHDGWGAAIRGNLIHDIAYNPAARREIGGWSAPGIYMDGAPNGLGCKNYLLENNVIYNIHTPLFKLGCKEGEITERDNIFLEKGTPSKEVLEKMQAKTGLETKYNNLLTK